MSAGCGPDASIAARPSVQRRQARRCDRPRRRVRRPRRHAGSGPASASRGFAMPKRCLKSRATMRPVSTMSSCVKSRGTSRKRHVDRHRHDGERFAPQAASPAAAALRLGAPQALPGIPCGRDARSRRCRARSWRSGLVTIAAASPPRTSPTARSIDAMVAAAEAGAGRPGVCATGVPSGMTGSARANTAAASAMSTGSTGTDSPSDQAAARRKSGIAYHREGGEGAFTSLQPRLQRDLRADAGRIALRQGERFVQSRAGASPGSLRDAVLGGAAEVLGKRRLAEGAQLKAHQDGLVVDRAGPSPGR